MSQTEQPAVISFMAWRKVAMAISIAMLVISIGSLFIKKLPLGFDFVGGLQIDARFEQPVEVESLRTRLEADGFKNATVVYYGSDKQVKFRLEQTREEIVAAGLQQLTQSNLSIVSIESLSPRQDARLDQGGMIITFTAQSLDQDAFTKMLDSKSIRIHKLELKDGQYQLKLLSDISEVTKVLFTERLLQTNNGQVEVLSTEFLSSNIGKELRDEGGLGLLVALVAVMIYVAIRFQYKFSLGAVAALIHDVIIVLGFFSLFGLDFDLTVLAALLAVIGYSLNDTIVVADRIRENFRLLRKGSPIEIIDISLSQTVGRTVITSLTTLLVLIAMLFVGGDALKGFSTALIVGVVVGTYSSIYVSANILVAMDISKQDLMPPEREGGVLDDMP